MNLNIVSTLMFLFMVILFPSTLLALFTPFILLDMITRELIRVLF